MTVTIEALQGQMPNEVYDRLNTVVGGRAGDPGATPMMNRGIIPTAFLAFATDASNADTITIGGHQFKFLTTLIAASGSFTQVKRGTSAAATLAALVDAINGTTNSLVVPCTTPFALHIVADDDFTTSLRIRWADSQGGTPVAGVSNSITLAEGLTPAGNKWNCANLNVTGAADTADQFITPFSFTVTTEMIAAGSFTLGLQFVASASPFSWEVRTAGALKVGYTDTWAVTGSNTITLTLVGGGTDILNGDVVSGFVVGS